MAVITVSRQFGSGGNEIVDQVCQLSSCRCFDKHLIAQAAIEAKLSEQEIIDFSDEAFTGKSFLDRLLGRSRPVGQVRVWKKHMDGTPYVVDMPVSEQNALSMVQKAIQAAYHQGDWIIVGRGGQVLLKEFRDVLHIRIEAPLEDRIQRVKVQYKLERRPAQDLIEEKDAASALYLKTFYNTEWADPNLYQVIFNTGTLDLNLAAHFIAEMMGCLKTVVVAG